MNEDYSHILVEFYEKLSSWENSIVADRAISLSQMHLIEVVGNHGSMRMKELSEKLGVTTGTLTVMTHRLESKGYILKEKDKKDKRSYFVRLSEKGLKEYRIHHQMHDGLIETIVDSLGQNESHLFFSRLKSLQDIL